MRWTAFRIPVRRSACSVTKGQKPNLLRTGRVGRVHHALMLTGALGIGKATLAYRIARFVLSPPEERISGLLGHDGLNITPGKRTSAQVGALSHPGLLVVRRSYDLKNKRFPVQIPVEEVRRLRGFLTHSAEGDAWRVIIVDQADEMTISAANALLKSLEEPPARCLYLLVSSQPGRLLPTIHSRCRRLQLAPLGNESLRDAVAQALDAIGVNVPTDDVWTKVANLSGGSVRRALQIVHCGGLELHDDLAALIASLPRLDRGRLIALADRLALKQREAEFEMFFALFGDTLANAARIAEGVSTDHVSEPVKTLAARLDTRQKVARCAMLWETLARDKAEADALNLDRKSLIVESMLRLEAVA